MASPLSLSLVLALASAAFAESDLGPGKPAPAIAVSEWVKGGPVTEFNKGHVYVVEFWATWCGPCKTSVPHITSLAKKHAGKVTVLGVSVWEQGDDIPGQVKKFVDEMGDKMDYHVAIDTADGKMAETWMRAAAQNGIPSAFVVDQEGRIAWIGHPMTMDVPLQQVVDGTFDTEAFKAEFARQAAKAEQDRLVRERINAIKAEYEKGDREALAKELDEIAAVNRGFAMEAAMAKLEIAADHEPATFTALALRLANGEDAERAALSQFVAITAMRAGRDPEAKNRLPKALVAADALLTKVSDNPVALYYAGLAYGESGKAAKAQELFERAWLLVDGSPLFPDAASRQRFLKTIDEARAKYRGG